jgi:SAM-dependent methyltransferase
VDTTTVRISIDIELEPDAAFAVFVDELAIALEQVGLRFAPGLGGGVTEDGNEVGRIVAWGQRSLRMDWKPVDWTAGERTEVDVSCEPIEGGSRVTLEERGRGRILKDSGAEAAGWFAGEMAGPLLRAIAPLHFGDWLTDRRARRPSGTQSRDVYADPVFHRPNFAVLLESLALEPSDHVLEVGIGAGALMKDALASGCRAAAIDHSADMIRLARRLNSQAAADGRLGLVEASADHLPFADDTFTAAVMTGVFGFLSDPVTALSEIRRVMRVGGRLAMLGSSGELKGTPAAPEPMASRLHFYEDEDIEKLARAAGLAAIRVERRNLGPYAKAAGVPAEALPLFDRGPGAQFLFATKGER